MAKNFWHNKRVLVTGGNGFLGRYVVQKLRERGAAEIIVPCSSQYDLRDINAIRQLFRDAVSKSEIRNPQSAIIVIHLAARVGGIGANREHPAEFFYDNLMMSVPLLHESWVAGVEKFVALGTICCYPNPSTSVRTWLTPVPRRETVRRLPRRDERAPSTTLRTGCTGWRKRCCSCKARRIGSSMGSTAFS